MLITSRANPRVKQLRELFHRKERERTGLFFVEGLRLVREAIQVHADIQLLIFTPETSNSLKELSARGEAADTPTLLLNSKVFASISPREENEEIAAVVRQRWQAMADTRLSAEPCWVALNEIQHPGNVGTILRVCDAVGGGGVILIGPSTDPYDPTAVRASLGTIFSQRLVKTSLPEFAAWKREHGYQVVGTSPAASTDYQAILYPSPVVVLMGGERIGLTSEHQALCDSMVRIPMIGRCESHHVAVATGLVLYEIFNQRRARGDGPGERPT